MRSRGFFHDVIMTIPITFVVVAVVTFLYSLVAHGKGLVNWETAFQLAFVLGIVLPFSRARARD